MAEPAHTIGLLIGSSSDRRLLTDFLRASGCVVRAGAASSLLPHDWSGVSLVIADADSARKRLAELTALRAHNPDVFLPLLILLPPHESAAPWLEAGFDDVLRLPLTKRELGARVSAYLRLHEQSAEQLSARLALAASEARFRSIFEFPAAGMAMADLSGRLLQVNAALCQFLGYSAGELIHAPVSALTHPDDRAETSRLFSEGLSGQRSTFALEKRYLRKDGALIWGHTAVVFLADAGRQPLCCIAIIQDITARKLAEAERDRLHEDLRASHERMRMLTRQVVQAQEDERKRVSRDLHDELGQSLAILKMSLRSIEIDLPEGADELRRRVQDASAQASSTIAQMRQLARDLRPLGLDEVGLYATLETLCQNFAEHSRLDIRCNVGGEEPALTAEVQIVLYRFVQEALTNVARHALARKVRVSVDGDSTGVRVSVLDDGQGFDVPSMLLRTSASSGIGLLGMRERIDLLGGQLKIESSPGKGTRLIAHIPLSQN